MKKLFAALALILALTPAAQAAQPGIIILEGNEEEILETKYHSDLGFSFDYVESLFTVDESMSENGKSLIIFPTGTDLPVYLELMTPESIGMSSQEFLESNAEPDIEFNYLSTVTGHSLVSFMKGDDLLNGFYTVSSNETFLAAYSSYPMEAAEGWGVYFWRILRSIRFDTDPPVWGSIEKEVKPEWLSFEAVKENPVYVLFNTTETVTNFRFLALEFPTVSDDGKTDFKSDVVYELPELTPEQPLCISMSFPGDVPSSGISYVDADGNTRYFSVSLSGMDGSLVVSEYGILSK